MEHEGPIAILQSEKFAKILFVLDSWIVLIALLPIRIFQRKERIGYS